MTNLVHLGALRYTVRSVINKFAKFGSVEILTGVGQKQKLSERTARSLGREVNSNPRVVICVIAKRLDSKRDCSCSVRVRTQASAL